MTAIDPAAQATAQLAAPEADTAPGTYLDYAAHHYEALAKQPPPMPTDVLIAATIGAGDEARANTVAVDRLTIAVNQLGAVIERLEAVLADQTSVLRAGFAEQTTTATAMQFPLEIAEDAQRAAEEAGG